MRLRSLARAAGVFSLSLAGGIACASSYSGLYVFGDSLSDVGNVYLATGGTVPQSPYFQGRFTNGFNWIDDLSAAIGLGAVLPSLAGGNDYAFGGAVTGTAVPSPPATVPSITQQVGLFSLASSGVASPTGLYTMWIGANDIYNAIDGVGASTLTFAAAQADLNVAAQTAAAALQTLAFEGARSFIVPLIPDLGKTPAVTQFPPLTGAATALTAGYNAALVNAIGAATSGLGVTVHYLDIFSLLDAAIADPASYGFSDVVDTCYVGTFDGLGTTCATPGSYLFWDHEHPTAAGHAAVAEVAITAAIPEPSDWMLMLAGIPGLLAVMRRVRPKATSPRSVAP